MYVNFMQNDWAHWCSSAEFAYNNHLSEAINCTSFFANSEQHSHMSTEPFVINTNLWDHEQAQQWMAQDFVTKMILINDTLQEQMTQAQTMYKEFSNRWRDHRLIIKKEDIIWLDARNLATECPSKKLSNKFKRPFHIIRTIRTHASKLKILEDWCYHDVFNNYLLRLAATDLLSEQVFPPLFPVILTEGEEEFEVKAIINSWMHWGCLEFLVRWMSYDRSTYQPFEDVKDATEALDDYFSWHSAAVSHEVWNNYDSDDHDSLYNDSWGFAGALS